MKPIRKVQNPKSTTTTRFCESDWCPREDEAAGVAMDGMSSLRSATDDLPLRVKCRCLRTALPRGFARDSTDRASSPWTRAWQSTATDFSLRSSSPPPKQSACAALLVNNTSTKWPSPAFQKSCASAPTEAATEKGVRRDDAEITDEKRTLRSTWRSRHRRCEVSSLALCDFFREREGKGFQLSFAKRLCGTRSPSSRKEDASNIEATTQPTRPKAQEKHSNQLDVF